jgi:hypothetical protein
VELVPDRRLSYALLSGLAIRGYRADIDLDVTAEDGTAIRWQSSFTSKIPGLGGVYRRALERFIRQGAEDLAAHAGQVHAGQARPGAA